MVRVFMHTVKFAEMALFVDCWWKSSMSTPSIRKKPKLGMILRSTKQSLSCFICLPAFNSKENYTEGVTNVPILQMTKLRPRDINEVTRKWKRCFLVSVQSIIRKLCGKVHCWSRLLGKNLDFNSFFQKKKKKIKCVTSTAKQCPRCLEGLLHLIENKIYEEIVINIPIYTSGSWGINDIVSK